MCVCFVKYSSEINLINSEQLVLLQITALKSLQNLPPFSHFECETFFSLNLKKSKIETQSLTGI